MSETIYDANARFYLEFIDRVLADDGSLFHILADYVRSLAPIDGAFVLDVACGEGYVSRLLSPRAREVVGIDISSELIEEARRRTSEANVSFRVDDAHSLGSFVDASVDVVVSQMAMMDIPDHLAVFRSVARVLRDGGSFVFSLLHPCFQSPHYPPDEPAFLDDEDGTHVAVFARRYTQEGHWLSGGDGVRGTMGSHHRMLSTYVNDLIRAGFRIEKLVEPVVEGDHLFARVPIVMVIAAVKA